LKRVASLLRDSGCYRWVGLYDVDRSAGKVVNIVWDGPGAPEFPEFPITKGLTGSAIAERRTVNVGDVSADSRYLTAFGTTRSEIIVPITIPTIQVPSINAPATKHAPVADTAVIGTIDIESDKPDAFDERTERLLETCAGVLRPLWSAQK
jgi:L-methionine (R)-S-oxide reductase